MAKTEFSGQNLHFRTKTAGITINYAQCTAASGTTTNPSCGFACVKACRLYGRNILKIENNRPSLAVTDDAEISRLDNECLACEYQCQMHGTGCISIDLPLAGLERYRDRTNRG